MTSKYKLSHNGDKYSVRYTIHRYINGGKEKINHILAFGRREFKGKSLDDVVNKFKKFLEVGADNHHKKR